MIHRRIFLTLLLLNTLTLPAMAARELVDDFNGATIDFTKWSGLDPADDISEYFVGVSTVDENLVLINAGDGSSLIIDQGSRVLVRDPDVSAMQATISVVSVEDGGGEAAANLEGQYYNANSAVPAKPDRRCCRYSVYRRPWQRLP